MDVTIELPIGLGPNAGQKHAPILTPQRTQLIDQLHPKYFTLASSGKLWSASSTTAAAIPIFATNATPTFGIFNPAGNNTAVVLCRYNVGLVAGTGVAGNILYMFLKGAGSAAAGTAAPISTFTAGPAIQPGLLGRSYTGNIVFGTSFTIGGAVNALAVHRQSNLSQGAPVTGTAAVYSLFEDFDGNVIIPPGTLWATGATTAIAETVVQSVLAYEVPIEALSQ